MIQRPSYAISSELDGLIAKWNSTLASAATKLRYTGCQWDRDTTRFEDHEYINHHNCGMDVTCGANRSGEPGELMDIDEIARFYDSELRYPSKTAPETILRRIIEELERDLSKDENYYDQTLLSADIS